MVNSRFIGALAVALTLAAPAHASVIYDFSFDNSAVNGGGTIEGTVTLPSSADGTYAASSVVVTSNTAGFGLGEYAPSFLETTSDSFVISGGNITSATVFLDFGDQNRIAGSVTCCSLEFQEFASILDGGLSNTSGEVTDGPGNPVTFTLATTPLPATLPLFAGGLSLLGGFGVWRKRRRSALAAA